MHILSVFYGMYLNRRMTSSIPKHLSNKTDRRERRVIKLAMEMLDREFREDQSAILSNEISRCMIQNNMTLENLDEACEIVREVFRKNATMKG